MLCPGLLAETICSFCSPRVSPVRGDSVLGQRQWLLHAHVTAAGLALTISHALLLQHRAPAIRKFQENMHAGVPTAPAAYGC